MVPWGTPQVYGGTTTLCCFEFNVIFEYIMYTHFDMIEHMK